MNDSMFTDRHRDSNLEVFRIILMLVIVAHHYVVNSGVTECYDFSNITPNMIFLQLYGFGGKIGINCFMLITGYFMVKSKWTLRKFVKLFLQIKFYKILIYAIFLISGYSTFGLKEFIKTIFNFTYGSGTGFSGSFIWLYLLIPFINILVEHMNQKQYKYLLGLSLIYFTVISTFFMHNTWDYVSWLIVIYLIGGYIRLYPKAFEYSSGKWFVCTSVLVAISWLSIIVVDYVGVRFGFENYYHMVNDCHKLFAVLIAVSAFMAFKNMKRPYNKYINMVASATFGVLLIHANSDIMRQFLWKDVLDVAGHYTSDTLWVHAILSVVGVYVICVVMDLVRIRFVEEPLFKVLDKKVNWDKISFRN